MRVCLEKEIELDRTLNQEVWVLIVMMESYYIDLQTFQEFPHHQPIFTPCALQTPWDSSDGSSASDSSRSHRSKWPPHRGFPESLAPESAPPRVRLWSWSLCVCVCACPKPYQFNYSFSIAPRLFAIELKGCPENRLNQLNQLHWSMPWPQPPKCRRGQWQSQRLHSPADARFGEFGRPQAVGMVFWNESYVVKLKP